MQVYKSLKYVLECNCVRELDLYFEYMYRVVEVEKRVSLVTFSSMKACERSLQVEESNKGEYVAQYIRCVSYETCAEGVEGLRRGFREVIPSKQLRLLTSVDLQEYFRGQDLDIEDMKLHTTYEDYSAESPQIVWLWQILSSFTKQD